MCALLLLRDTNGEEEVLRTSDTVIKCSTTLSTLIDNLCENTYRIIKRDTSASLLLAKLSPQAEDAASRGRAMARWRRVRRQVATECCEKACTVATIISYCPDDARLVKEHPEIFD